ncbi:serine protease persephone [Zeugodacus cucurbitae]|uniref:serine protease persephone n=1 Tax=Zeugodacus cucurbitae TaxID=28588 RepID=UPI0023D90D77|nr:serine protease persephone [Zeugodacus cucurbitae]
MITMLKEYTRLYIFLIICGLGATQDYEEGDSCDFAGYNGTCLAKSNCHTLPFFRSLQIGRCDFLVFEEMICCPNLPIVQTPPKNLDPSPVESSTEGIQIGSHTRNVVDNNKLDALIQEIFGKNAPAENETETNHRNKASATDANEKYIKFYYKIWPGHALGSTTTTTVKPGQVLSRNADLRLHDIFSLGNANNACETRHYKGVCKPRLQCTHLAQSLTDMRLQDNDVPLCGREDMICCPNTVRPAVRACRAIERGLPPFQEEHIIGGDKVSILHYPHMAKIVYERSNFVCGGTLIHERFVLTAAHCVIVRGTNASKVIMGVADLTDTKSRSRQEIDIETTFEHPRYSSFSKYFDIALIKLKKNVTFSLAVYPTCLHTDPTELPDGVELTAAGWGLTEKQVTSEHLMAVQLNKVPHAECNQSYAYHIDRHLKHGIDDTQLCALAPGKDTCGGDSGGPLLLLKNATYNSYRIVGVVSFGDLMCGHTTPGVYTRVSAFLDFIEDIVWPEALRKQ